MSSLFDGTTGYFTKESQLIRANTIATEQEKDELISSLKQFAALPQAEQYRRIFPQDQELVTLLLEKEIPLDQADELAKRLIDEYKDWGVKAIIQQDIPLDIALSYSQQYFSSQDIILLYEQHITPEQAKMYQPNFTPHLTTEDLSATQIIKLIEAQIPPTEIRQAYNRSVDDIIQGKRVFGSVEASMQVQNIPFPILIKAQETRGTIDDLLAYDTYLTPLNANDVIERAALGVSVAETKALQGMSARGIVQLKKQYGTLAQIEALKNKYDRKRIGIGIRTDNLQPRINRKIEELMLRGIMPELVDAYDKRSPHIDFLRIDAYELSISNNENNKLERYEAHIDRIIELHQEGITPDEAASYDKRFNTNEIIHLHAAQVSPKEANNQNKSYNGLQLALIKQLHINPATAPQTILTKIQPISKDQLLDMRLLGTGNRGIIILNTRNQQAQKVGIDLQKERFNLELITANKPRNVIQLAEEQATIVKGPINQISIQYINGATIEQKLKQKLFSYAETTRYGAHIMNGLIEMRHAGLWYHHDIRPANIMIDEEQDEAIIIDLSTATRKIRMRKMRKSRHANRRYGSPTDQPNDLISLGQLMYKMATGEHIFLEKEQHEDTCADELRKHRNWIYKQEERLQPYLQKIDENIQDHTLANTIKKLLTSKESHYTQLQQHFQKTIAYH